LPDFTSPIRDKNSGREKTPSLPNASAGTEPFPALPQKPPCQPAGKGGNRDGPASGNGAGRRGKKRIWKKKGEGRHLIEGEKESLRDETPILIPANSGKAKGGGKRCSAIRFFSLSLGKKEFPARTIREGEARRINFLNKKGKNFRKSGKKEPQHLATWEKKRFLCGNSQKKGTVPSIPWLRRKESALHSAAEFGKDPYHTFPGRRGESLPSIQGIKKI